MLIEKVPVQSQVVSPEFERGLHLAQAVLAESWSQAHLTPVIPASSRRGHGTHRGPHPLTQDLNDHISVRCEGWGRGTARGEGWLGKS